MHHDKLNKLAFRHMRKLPRIISYQYGACGTDTSDDGCVILFTQHSGQPQRQDDLETDEE
ncbi:hypothetical protein DMS22_20975 [Klebsiella variicola]|nr:hypothetical protein DMS22_20975 [Klebsiella variicola]